jgi:hypothetical protein
MVDSLKGQQNNDLSSMLEKNLDLMNDKLEEMKEAVRIYLILVQSVRHLESVSAYRGDKRNCCRVIWAFAGDAAGYHRRFIKGTDANK